MGLLPKKKELTRFSKEHPFLSLVGIMFMGFTAISTIESFTLPRGEGPFSWKKKMGLGNLGSLGATTSTSTTTSSSHPAVVRETMQSQANRFFKGKANFDHPVPHNDGFYGVSTSTSTSSAHPPGIRQSMMDDNTLDDDNKDPSHLGIATHPALRRRLSTGRMTPTTLGGSHIGKQIMSDDDERERQSNDGFNTMFGIGGILPEMGGVWTE
tara:strand:- start:291 stop:923 length:633 start_codon:yes stop_codon:yes gene_type:complete